MSVKFFLTTAFCMASNMAYAQEYPTCHDSFGTPVQYVDIQTEHDVTRRVNIAGARYLNFEQEQFESPAIVLDTDYLSSLSSIEQDFIFAHECYHLSSGDAREMYHNHIYLGIRMDRSFTRKIELDADCHAARILRNNGYNYSDIEDIQELLRGTTANSRLEERINNINACFPLS